MKKLSDILEGGVVWSKAHWNTYRIVTKMITWDELLEEDPTVLIICSPDELEDPDTIQSLIDYYEHKEEYEKCSELKEIK